MENHVDCECEEWWNSAGQIFNAQVQYTIMTGNKYTGLQFKYCPWCGLPLVNPDKITEKKLEKQRGA